MGRERGFFDFSEDFFYFEGGFSRMMAFYDTDAFGFPEGDFYDLALF